MLRINTTEFFSKRNERIYFFESNESIQRLNALKRTERHTARKQCTKKKSSDRFHFFLLEHSNSSKLGLPTISATKNNKLETNRTKNYGTTTGSNERGTRRPRLGQSYRCPNAAATDNANERVVYDRRIHRQSARK